MLEGSGPVEPLRGFDEPGGSGGADARWAPLEQVTLLGKGVNEDEIGVSGDLAWVIDGASALSEDEPVTDAPSDARWIVDIAHWYLRGCAGDPRPLRRIVGDLIDEVAGAVSRLPSVPEVPPSAALGLARCRDGAVEYLLLADVTIAFAISGRPPVVVCDDAVERTAERAFRRFRDTLVETRSHAAARQAARSLQIEHRRQRMNTPGGYWVLAVHREAANRARAGRIDGVTGVVLCTDGFARVVDPFGLATWDQVLEPGTGLEGLAERLRAAEADDRGCLTHPRWSVHDDLAALRIAPVWS